MPADPPPLLSLQPGQSAAYSVPEGRSLPRERNRLSCTAHRKWGIGSYRTRVEGGQIIVERLVTAAPRPADAIKHLDAQPQLGAPVDEEPDGYLTRAQAAARIARRLGFRVTAGTLRNLAHARRGPPYVMFGQRALYSPQAIDTWIEAGLRAPAAGPALSPPPQKDQHHGQ